VAAAGEERGVSGAQRIGVCSWSLRPRSPADLAGKVRDAGLELVQLALDPLREGTWPIERTRRELERAGVAIASGMMAAHGEDYATLETIRATGGLRPDAHWERNLDAAKANAFIARELGLQLVSFHPGVLPHERGDPERAKLLDRLLRVVDAFAAQDVAVALETGQESAATLLEVLEELGRPELGVNFDPANMLLYGTGEPIAALEALAPHVRQVHVKDALPAARPGAWGTEVVAGTGAVDWPAFFALLRRRRLAVDLLIEREAGDRRVEDVRTARALAEAALTAEG
jgi:L-ribulose-5-phosphate 3-epimerase